MLNRSHTILTALVFAVSAASASPISYEFTTSWYEGELTGIVSKGQFTYDSSRVQAGATVNALDLFSYFDFSLRDFYYTNASVQSAYATFDLNGDLQATVFGTNCSLQMTDGGEVGTCGVASNRIDQFFIQYNAAHPLYAGANGDGDDPFVYPGFSSGRTTIRRIDPVEAPQNVPEPGTSLLLCAGLAAISLLSRVTKGGRG